MKQSLFALLFGLLSCHMAVSQNEYNKKNVDRTAMSFYDGLQTFRAMECTVTADPQSQKVYRLETLPENGFPAIDLQGVDNGAKVFFEDKTPYDNMFTDNPTPYLSAEAVQLHYGFQKVMKAFDQRFGWKGIDGTGTAPIHIAIENSDGTPDDSYAYYSFNLNTEYFAFGRGVQKSTPLFGSIDAIAHEFSHAIMQRMNNVTSVPSPCAEYRSIDEGLAHVFGIYIKNKILQSNPQNYNWLILEPVMSVPHDLGNPKSHLSADTYKGQYYLNTCSPIYTIHGGFGVVGRWFYLLSSGFTGSAINDLGYQYSNLTGIGVEKAIQIIWNAVPNIKNYTDYPGFRTLTLKATEQLYGLPYKTYFGKIFKWNAGTVNMALVDHFKVRVEEKESGQVAFFNTPGKALEKEIVDQLIYDDHLGIEVSVLAVGPQGAETGLSSVFSYTICQDQPIPKFPNDNDKIDPALPVTITWEPSLWQEPGEQYLVTILSNGNPVNGFNNAPTLSTSMLLPAGTLGNGKNYTLIIKNSGSCAGLDPWTVFFSTIAGANNNPPATPKKDLSIQLNAFRYELDPSDPFPFENSDYTLGFEVLDPDGNKVEVVDGIGNTVSELLVDSENAVLGMFAKDQPVGKYTLKLKMLSISNALLYNPVYQPSFSVILNGQTVINEHIITIKPFDPVYDEWKVNFQFTDITLDHK